MQISRIQLSDKTSRLRPRHVVPKPVQACEPEVPVQVREWIVPALAPPPDFVLGAQPPTQPHCRVIVERSISRADGAYLEVVRPSAQHAVQLAHQHCGLLPCPRSIGQRVDFDRRRRGRPAAAAAKPKTRETYRYACRAFQRAFPEKEIGDLKGDWIADEYERRTGRSRRSRFADLRTVRMNCEFKAR
jgi:hypothetical protein